jgi:predicted DsbA family dithiol-disulfide isomerase
MSELTITEFTDPGCPFAWSAEPSRWRLRWLYGDQLRWRLRMVGLAETPDVYADKGFTPERQSHSFAQLGGRHHMPMDTGRRPRMAATVPACRAVVATRLHAPDAEAALLRALRIEHFAGQLLDEPDTIAAAARRAGLDPDALQQWIAEPATEERLREDLDEARHPTPAAVALSHKLASTEDGGWRYTCPSYEIDRDRDGASLSVPGFQPTLAYEVAIANLAPELARREDPESVTDVLEWAGEPLATIEIAEVCGIDFNEAREQLGRVAGQEHIGPDGLWSLEAVAA